MFDAWSFEPIDEDRVINKKDFYAEQKTSVLKLSIKLSPVQQY